MAEIGAEARVVNAVLGSLREWRETVAFQADKLSLIVGVSGGVDSVVLLHCLSRIANTQSLHLVAAHVDHSLRPESKSELEFVRGFAASLDLKFLSTKLEPLNSGNTEAWAREKRYAFFEECMREEKAALTLTAHHLDDQAETFLMRLFSGRLMSSAFTIAQFDSVRSLLRPLAGVSRKEIQSYAKINNLSWVEDSSNSDVNRSRNFLRHEVLPLVAKHWGDSTNRRVAAVAEKTNQDETFLWGEARRAREKVESNLTKDVLGQLPEALRWRVLALEAKSQLGNLLGASLGFAQLKDLENEVLGCGRRTSVAKDAWMWVERDGSIVFGNWNQEMSDASSLSYELRVPGELKFGEQGAEFLIKATILSSKSELAQVNSELNQNLGREGGHQQREYFDFEVLAPLLHEPNRLNVRSRQEGDVLRVWSRGKRKLKKLFQERGVKLTARNHVPIVECGSEIIWVPGVARSEMAPVTSSSKEILSLDCHWSVDSFSSS